MNEVNNSDNLDYSAPPRSFIEAIKVCFAKYSDFKGRASRSEFWWFHLAQSLFLALLGIGTSLAQAILALAVALAILVPYCAVGVRRFHDTNRSGVGFISLAAVIFLSVVLSATDLGEDSLFLALVVLICTICIFWMSATPGKKQRNKYNLPTDLGREQLELNRTSQMNEVSSNDNLDYSAPTRSFIEAIKVCFAKFAVFKGRASRSEFWWFHLFSNSCASWFSFGLSTVGLSMIDAPNEIRLMLAVLAHIVLLLAILVPYYAVGVRRFHDTNRSGVGFISLVTLIFLLVLLLGDDFGDRPLLTFVLAICVIALLYLCATRGKKQRNKYNLPTDVGREITS